MSNKEEFLDDLAVKADEVIDIPLSTRPPCYEIAIEDAISQVGDVIATRTRPPCYEVAIDAAVQIINGLNGLL